MPLLCWPLASERSTCNLKALLCSARGGGQPEEDLAVFDMAKFCLKALGLSALSRWSRAWANEDGHHKLRTLVR